MVISFFGNFFKLLAKTVNCSTGLNSLYVSLVSPEKEKKVLQTLKVFVGYTLGAQQPQNVQSTKHKIKCGPN